MMANLAKAIKQDLEAMKKVNRDDNFYYDSTQPLKTSQAHHHQIGVVINDSFTSKLDDRQYVDISAYSIDTWSVPSGRRARVEDWRTAVINQTEWVVGELERAIEELTRHRDRLQWELTELVHKNDEEEE